jgi:hypothetical protein
VISEERQLNATGITLAGSEPGGDGVAVDGYKVSFNFIPRALRYPQRRGQRQPRSRDWASRGKDVKVAYILGWLASRVFMLSHDECPLCQTQFEPDKLAKHIEWEIFCGLATPRCAGALLLTGLESRSELSRKQAESRPARHRLQSECASPRGTGDIA